MSLMQDNRHKLNAVTTEHTMEGGEDPTYRHFLIPSVDELNTIGPIVLNKRAHQNAMHRGALLAHEEAAADDIDDGIEEEETRLVVYQGRWVLVEEKNNEEDMADDEQDGSSISSSDAIFTV